MLTQRLSAKPSTSVVEDWMEVLSSIVFSAQMGRFSTKSILCVIGGLTWTVP